MYQTHCSICFVVFNAKTLEELYARVKQHEDAKSCAAPVYDAKGGTFTERHVAEKESQK